MITMMTKESFFFYFSGLEMKRQKPGPVYGTALAERMDKRVVLQEKR